MKAKTFNKTPSGFTLVELLVVITIIGVLMAIGIPTMTKMRTSAQRSACIGQLRDWGIILGTFGAENDGKIRWDKWASIGTDPAQVSVYLPYMTPETVDVTTRTDGGSYDKLLQMRNCPSKKWDKTKGNSPVSYAMIRPDPNVSTADNKGGEYTYLSKISNPSRFIFMIDAVPTTKTYMSSGDFTTRVKPLTVKGENLRHDNANVNALMGDFSVRAMMWKDLEKGLSYWTTY